MGKHILLARGLNAILSQTVDDARLTNARPRPAHLRQKHNIGTAQHGCAGDGELCIPVGCSSQIGMQQNLHALAGQVPRGFRKPNIVTDRQAEPCRYSAHRRRRIPFQRQCQSHRAEMETFLRYFATNLTLRIDDNRRIEYAAVRRLFKH